MSKYHAFFIIFLLPLLAVVGLLGLLSPLPAVAQSAILSGDCAIRVESNLTIYTDLQSALNAATDDDLLRVAGTCVGVNNVNGLSQAGYITRSVTIQGGYTTANWVASDPAAYPSVIDAGWNGRGLVISSTTPINVLVDSLTIQRGSAAGYGGGVFITNTAMVTLHQLILSENEAYLGEAMSNLGGAIYNASQLTVTHSVLLQNYAEDGGAAIYGATGSQTYLHNSTITDNWSENGVVDSMGTLSVTFSSIVNNFGPVLAGDVANSIVAGNYTLIPNPRPNPPSRVDTNCGPDLVSAGYNVLGDDCAGIAQGTDVLFSDALFTDLLEPLADNGGATPTHALYFNSVAVGLANGADCPATDQRGEPRTPAICDAGAFQLAVSVQKLVSNINPEVGEVVTYTLLVINPPGTPLSGGILSDTLPAGVMLAGSVTLDPMSAGTMGAFPEIVTDINLAGGGSLTVTFPVTVTASGGSEVINTAVFTATNLLKTKTSQVIFNTKNCFARPDSNGVVYTRLQTALDAASNGDTVRVAGLCDGLETVNGTPQVGYIDQDLTLRGGYTTTNWITSDPIANLTVIDGVNSGRGLRVNGNITVLIENLTIRNGDASGLGGAQFSSDGGAAVLNTNANLTLNNVILFDNEVDAGDAQEARGGALASDGGDVVINHSRIYNNFLSGSYSYGGGVMAANGLLTINESEIYNNTAVANNMDGSGLAEGGGVYVAQNAAASIVDSRIASNSAQGTGGGLATGSNATLTMTGSEVAENIAQQQGGGLYLPRVTAVISQSRIHSNVVNGLTSSSYGRQGGGGLYISSNSNVAIRQTLVASNTVNTRGLGGGIAVNCWRCTNTIVVENSTLSGNTAVEGGGGFSSYIEQDFTGGTNSDILFNHATILNNNATSGNGHALNQERETSIASDGVTTSVSHVTSSFTYQNSLIAGNGGANECHNNATHDPASLLQTSSGYNLFIAGAGCTDNGATDQTATDQATLFSDFVSATLSDQGGNTLVHALNSLGTAVDAIPDGTNGCDGGASVDQRDAVRAGEIVPGDGRGGIACDIGAHEGESSQTPTAVTMLAVQAQSKMGLNTAVILLLFLLLALTTLPFLYHHPSEQNLSVQEN